MSGWGLRRFDACMKRIQTQEGVRFVQVWCFYEKGSDAGVGEVYAGLMLVWEGFRRRCGWGLCRFDAQMIRTETHEWVRFARVWCLYEKDSDARGSEVCAGWMLVWEGFRRRCVWGLCRFDACMRRIQTQGWVRFVQVWCTNDKDWDAWVGEVCAGLMLVWEGFRRRCVCEVYAELMLGWEGFRRRCGWGLCRFDAQMIRIETHERVRFAQVWCL